MAEKQIINDERAIRIEKLKALRGHGVNAYPSNVVRTHSIADSLQKKTDTEVKIAGRLMTKRDMGKLTFCNLVDETGKIQIAFKKDEMDEEQYSLFIKKIDIGDIIAIEGTRFLTQKGEESVLVKKWTLASKALLPLPDKFYGLQNEELRYRKRYLDLLLDPGQKNNILVRSRVLKYMRDFFDKKGFVEVETPILETVSSGALAKSFDTYLNAYDLPVHLRICIGELWQKRLLVAGFEKTYEIGRAFRNEGVDHSHNPEFSMLESYWAFSDYEDNMNLQEELISYVVEKSVGTLKIENENEKIDFTPPFPRITFREAILKHTGIDINDFPTTESVKKVMQEKKLEVEDTAARGKLLDMLYKQTARLHINQPTFVTEYPIELKPLAKAAKDPRYTESAQLIIRGFELSNSFSELNDPLDQRARFEQQAEQAAAGEEESMQYDYDYVEALEHGMPPASGNGIGIDRFVALITGAHTLREVTAFPLMKPIDSSDSTFGKSKQTLVAHAVLLNTSKIENWVKLNAAAHLSASFGAREGKKLIHIDSTSTKDGEKIPMNIQHAIIMKQAEKKNDLLDLKREADNAGLVVTCFTEEMCKSSDDTKVKVLQENKMADEIEFLGVLLFGSKKEVEQITKKFPLIS